MWASPRNSLRRARLPSAPPRRPPSRNPCVEVHPNPPPTEPHALEREAQALFLAVVPGKRDPPPRGDDPMPRQSDPRPEGPHGEPRGARGSGQGSDLAVRHHLPPRDPSDHRAEPSEGRHAAVPRPALLSLAEGLEGRGIGVELAFQPLAGGRFDFGRRERLGGELPVDIDPGLLPSWGVDVHEL